MLKKGKITGLGAVIGLVLGPLLGFWLIKVSNVAYLETAFALNWIAFGIGIGFLAGVIIMIFFSERVTHLNWNMVLGLLIFAIIIDVAEIVIMLRRMIP